YRRPAAPAAQAEADPGNGLLSRQLTSGPGKQEAMGRPPQVKREPRPGDCLTGAVPTPFWTLLARRDREGAAGRRLTKRGACVALGLHNNQPQGATQACALFNRASALSGA